MSFYQSENRAIAEPHLPTDVRGVERAEACRNIVERVSLTAIGHSWVNTTVMHGISRGARMAILRSAAATDRGPSLLVWLAGHDDGFLQN